MLGAQSGAAGEERPTFPLRVAARVALGLTCAAARLDFNPAVFVSAMSCSKARVRATAT